MYNKIASIILNLAKVPGAGAVYVSQPNAEKEKIAGKLFLLAELGGKKSDIEKFLNFLISELEENYYSDEKILLIGKLEGLKPENIFEAALAKTNKSINEFLKDHKLKLDPALTDITLGVICGNKLHFTSFGKNRSLLIYRRQDGFEIINVETDAKISDNKNEADDKKTIKGNHLFSSIISGEVPVGSYFVFASESLPEYLSSRDLVGIITKLPPIVAAEQIKNVLAKINNYVPFLGIIIKNTTDQSGREEKESGRTPLSTHNSISSLNYTEAKTESMLSPAGLIKFSQVGKIIRSWLHPKSANKQTIDLKDNISNKLNGANFSAQNKQRKVNLLNLPSSSSFSRPHKILLKKGSRRFFGGLKQFIFFLLRLFSPSFWRNLFSNSSSWFKNLSRKKLLLFAGLILIFIAIGASIINANVKKNNKQKIESFNLAITEIEEKEALIDPYLLYDNKDSANRVLSDITNLMSNIPRDEEYQIARYNEVAARISTWEDKINGIIRVSEVKELASYPNLDIHGLTIANETIIANSNSSLYSLTLDNNESQNIEVTATSLQNGRYFIDNDTIYYRNNEQIISLNVKDKTTTTNTLANFNESETYTGFNLYNNSLYLVSQAQNQIFVYPASNLSSRKNWLKESADLSRVNDIYIDGSIYLLERDGKINKFYSGRALEYNNKALEPSTQNAQKLLGDKKYLYILADNKVIVVNKEDGKQVAQYLFNNLNISDFAISPKGDSIYLLSEGSVYNFSIVSE